MAEERPRPNSFPYATRLSTVVNYYNYRLNISLIPTCFLLQCNLSLIQPFFSDAIDRRPVSIYRRSKISRVTPTRRDTVDRKDIRKCLGWLSSSFTFCLRCARVSRQLITARDNYAFRQLYLAKYYLTEDYISRKTVSCGKLYLTEDCISRKSISRELLYLWSDYILRKTLSREWLYLWSDYTLRTTISRVQLL